MTNRYVALVALAFITGFASTLCHAGEFLGGRVKADGAVRAGWQSLEADSGAFASADTDSESGFHRIRFNLNLHIKISERISAYVELAEEPNDFGNIDPFSISNDLAYIDFSILDPDSTNDLTIRAGEIVTSVVNFRGYSDGAQVDGNSLIGNSPADMLTAETGLQVLGSLDLGDGPVKRLNGDVAVSVPTFFENFSGDRPYNYMVKGSLDFRSGFSVGAGYAFNDGGDQVVGPTPVGNVFTMGLVRGDNENYNFPSGGASSNQTHSFLVPGVEVDVLHIDGQYKGTSVPLTVRAWYGQAEDDFSFTDAMGNRVTRPNAVNISALESEMSFYGATVVFNFTGRSGAGNEVVRGHRSLADQKVGDRFADGLFGSVRYVKVTNDSPNSGVDDELERIQIGLAAFMTTRSLIKIEYVSQNEGVNSTGQIGSDWDGVLVEVSVFF